MGLFLQWEELLRACFWFLGDVRECRRRGGERRGLEEEDRKQLQEPNRDIV